MKTILEAMKKLTINESFVLRRKNKVGFDYMDGSRKDNNEIISEEKSNIKESKKLIEAYTAKQDSDALIKRVSRYNELNPDSQRIIKELAVTDSFILLGIKNLKTGDIDFEIAYGYDNVVDVHVDSNDKGKITDVKINWASIGGVNSEKAKEVMKELEDAIKLSEEINNKDYSNEISK